MSNFAILYVADPLKSARFYEELFGRKPVEASPGFVMFVYEGGAKLGLWLRPEVQPPVTAAPGGAELCYPLESDAAVDQRFADWTAKGITMLQAPTDMDFGHTFVAADPDGHRLRLYHPGAN